MPSDQTKTPASAELSASQQAEQEAFARRVLEEEAKAVTSIVLGVSFHEAVDLILKATGGPAPLPGHCPAPGGGPRPAGGVVVSGLGKSGLIGQKLSATFASTGTPSHFLHATEAMHGDLGRIRNGDVVILLSYGGSTQEVLELAALLKQDKVPIIAITGSEQSDLARLATLSLCIGAVHEACPLNLAPTASTTAMLALGDALALAVARRRNFGVDDFRKMHPGGGLGRQLMPVHQAMRFRAGENLPLIQPQVTIEQAFAQAERDARGRRPGALIIVDEQGKLAGIFTDGDLRRMFIKHGSEVWRQPIGGHMTRKPRCLQQDALVRDAVQMVREFRIDEIPVVDEQGHAVGLIDVQDLVALKVIEG